MAGVISSRFTLKEFMRSLGEKRSLKEVGRQALSSEADTKYSEYLTQLLEKLKSKTDLKKVHLTLKSVGYKMSLNDTSSPIQIELLHNGSHYNFSISSFVFQEKRGKAIKERFESGFYSNMENLDMKCASDVSSVGTNGTFATRVPMPYNSKKVKNWLNGINEETHSEESYSEEDTSNDEAIARMMTDLDTMTIRETKRRGH